MQKKICDYQRGKGRRRDKLGTEDQQTQTTIYKIDKQERPTGQHRELFSISYDGKEYEKIYIYLNHFAIYQKLIQGCKSTIPQNFFN